MQKVDFSKELGDAFVCGCGRTHFCEVEDIIIGDHVLEQLPEILGRYEYKNICIVSDINTEKAAGIRLYGILEHAGIPFEKIVFQDTFLVPDEAAMGKLIIEISRDCDLILAVGSGTLNDICKFMSYKLKTDYFIIATAPSMDGFASNVAPLIVNHAKTTFEVGMPKVIIGDLDVLSQAPMEMIAAGVGDALGKYVCLMDWRLAHIIKGEYHCGHVEQMVRTSIEKVSSAIEAVVERDKEAICSVMEGLVLTGIAMSYIGNSRPASGSEHHLSHYWEMMALMTGKKIQLHGTKVAIGTVIGLELYEYLLKNRELVLKKAVRNPEFDYSDWMNRIKEAYGPAADAVIELEGIASKNADQTVLQELEGLIKHADLIFEEIKKLPSAESLVESLKLMGAKYKPEQVEVDDQTLADSIVYAKELRNRFGLLQLIYDLDMHDDAINHIQDFFERL